MKQIEIIWKVLMTLAMAGIVIFALDLRKQSEQAKKLKENVEVVVNYDSIISAHEKRFLDSLDVLRKSLEESKKFQHNENRKLRKKNEELEGRFRDLDLGDRPEF